MNHHLKLQLVLPSLLLLLSLNVMAQNTKKETTDFNPYLNLSFGLSMINNGGDTRLPFDGDFNMNTPFFLTAEHRIHKNWSMALTLTTNQLKLYNPAMTTPYFSADVFANLFVDQFIFNNENIELYVGLGTGIHTVDGKGTGSFNGTGGFRYWVSEKMAINLQAIAKVNRDGLPQVANHYQFNAGVTYTFKQKTPVKKALPVNPVAVVADSSKVAEAPHEYKEPEEFSLDGDKEVKKPVTVSSTELAKDAYEAEQIKKNAGAALNKKSSNARPANVKKGYYVVVYAFEYKNNLDRMVRLLTDNGIKVQVIRVADKNLDYVSVAYFTSSAEAHNYMNKTLDKKLFTDSWVYEVE